MNNTIKAYHISKHKFTEFKNEFVRNIGDFPIDGFYFAPLNVIKKVWKKVRPTAVYLYEVELYYDIKLYYEDKLIIKNFWKTFPKNAIYIDTNDLDFSGDDSKVLQYFITNNKNIKIKKITKL